MTTQDDNDQIMKHIFSMCSTQSLSVVKQNLSDRLQLGRDRYGHGVIIDSNVSQWTENKTDDWLEMAYEEFYDGLIYLSAAYFRSKKNKADEKQLSKIENAMKCLLSGIEELVVVK
tara:strand:- start:19 stop:366 length:348 start_codon:yes stop_codon:yes gene_type:complete